MFVPNILLKYNIFRRWFHNNFSLEKNSWYNFLQISKQHRSRLFGMFENVPKPVSPKWNFFVVVSKTVNYAGWFYNVIER